MIKNNSYIDCLHECFQDTNVWEYNCNPDNNADSELKYLKYKTINRYSFYDC